MVTRDPYLKHQAVIKSLRIYLKLLVRLNFLEQTYFSTSGLEKEITMKEVREQERRREGQ